MAAGRSSPTALEKTQAALAAAGLIPPIGSSSKAKPRKSKEFKSREVIDDDYDLDEEMDEPVVSEVQKESRADDVDNDNDNDDDEEDEEDDDEASPSPRKQLDDAPPYPGLSKVTEPGPPEFDYSALSSNPNLDIWLIRVPPNIKPKYLEGLELDLQANDQGRLGSFKRKDEVFEIRDAKDAGGAEEMQGLTVLLREEGKGKATHKIAPRPVARHLVITQSLPSLPTPTPTSTGSSSSRTRAAITAQPSQPPPDYTIASMRPPSKAQPERLSYRFAPVGTWEHRKSIVDGLPERREEEEEDVVMADVVPVVEKPKKKKRESAEGVAAVASVSVKLESAEKPKKKKRKSETGEAESKATAVLPVDVQINGEPAKKKKKRHSEEGASVAAAPAPAVPVDAPADGEKKKKKKRRDSAADAAIAPAPEPEKKSKKRKHEDGETPKVKKPKHESS